MHVNPLNLFVSSAYSSKGKKKREKKFPFSSIFQLKSEKVINIGILLLINIALLVFDNDGL